MEHKKSVVMLAWFFVALILFCLLAFLLLASDGLEIKAEQGEGFDEFVITVSNSSQHAIHFISVTQEGAENKLLGFVPALQPNESESFQIPVQASRLNVSATAPFHKTATESIFLQPKKPFLVSIEKPGETKTGQAFELNVQVCNQSTETRIVLEENHDPGFFGQERQTMELEIPNKQCRNASFSFEATFSGQTSVNFNIKSDSFSEELEQNLTIQP
jgi:hypothetical protein